MKNENWYYVCNLKTLVATDYMQLPDTWGIITGLSGVDDESLKSLVWVSMPDIAFLKRADAIAANIDQNSMKTCREVSDPGFVNYVSRKIQDRLENFAKMKNYDTILSAISYSNSAVAEFKKDAETALKFRDDTWNTFYGILKQVQDGSIPYPESYAEIEVKLPSLNWD